MAHFDELNPAELSLIKQEVARTLQDIQETDPTERLREMVIQLHVINRVSNTNSTFGNRLNKGLCIGCHIALNLRKAHRVCLTCKAKFCPICAEDGPMRHCINCP